jgi:hypothetical protein
MNGDIGHDKFMLTAGNGWCVRLKKVIGEAFNAGQIKFQINCVVPAQIRIAKFK